MNNKPYKNICLDLIVNNEFIDKDKVMASRTMQTRCRRRLKLKKMGKKRKAANRNKGTTPKFSIHPDKE